MTLTLDELWAEPVSSGSPRSRRGTTKPHNKNSTAARREITPRLAGHRLRVLEMIAAQPDTDNGLIRRWVATGGNVNTARARRVELENMGYVESAGDRNGSAVWRSTQSGCAAMAEARGEK